MANVVEILIKARDESARAMGQATGRLDKLAAKAHAARGPLLAMSAAIIGIGAASVKMAADFETAMAEVRTLLPDLDKGGMEKLRQGVLEFSKELGITTTQAVPALYQAISAGVPPDNVLEFMRIAARASIGGVTSLETAVDGITSAVNAYGKEVLDAGSASDLMFTAVRLGKTTFDELSRSLFNVIPTAASLDITFAEVAASMATMTAQGVPTRVATTNLRQAFVEASKTGSNLDKAIREMAGTGLAQLTKEGRTAFSVFNELRESMPEQEFRDLFGSVEALNAVLLTTGPQAAGMQRAMDEMGTATGAADAAFEIIADSSGFKFQKALAETQAALIDIGSVLLSFAASIASGIASITGAFSDLSRPAQTAIIVVSGVALALSALGLALPTLIGGVKILTKAFIGLRAVMATTLGLALLIPVAFDLAARGINAFFRALEEAGAGFAPQFMLPMTELGRLLGTVMDGFISGAEEVTKFGDVAQVTQEELDKLTENLNRTDKKVREVVVGIGAGSVAVGEFASELDDLDGALSTNRDGFREFLEAVKRTTEAADILGISYDEMVAGLDALEDAGASSQRAWEELARAFEGQVSSGLRSVIKDLFGIGNAAESAERKVVSLIQALARAGGGGMHAQVEAARKFGAGPGGLSLMLDYMERTGKGFVDASTWLNRIITSAAASGGQFPTQGAASAVAPGFSWVLDRPTEMPPDDPLNPAVVPKGDVNVTINIEGNADQAALDEAVGKLAELVNQGG